MRLFSAALCTTVAVSLLAGCSGNTSSPGSSVPTVGANIRAHAAGLHGFAVNAIPQRFLPTKFLPIRGRRATSGEMRGIYVSTFAGTDLYGFPKNNSGNGPPTCTVGTAGGVNNFGVDNLGNVMIPNGDEVSGEHEIYVYGPSVCGPFLGSIVDRTASHPMPLPSAQRPEISPSAISSTKAAPAASRSARSRAGRARPISPILA